LTPSGILHTTTFVSLCEAYMGIEPHFDMWNYFFHARLQQGSDTETSALGSVDILVRSGPGVDPYFYLPISDPPVGRQKIWFFLRDNADMLLPVFMCSYPIPRSNWGMVWP
jgi:hypothetical protein